MSSRALTRTGERHLVLDYLLGMPVKELAVKYEITRQTIYRIFARHEIEPERKAS